MNTLLTFHRANGDAGNKVLLLKCKHRPTAVIAINDYGAVGAVRAAGDAGLYLPEDMSIISFDNTFLSEVVRPKLTSIDYNYPEYGKTLIEMAIQAAEGEEPGREQFIKPRLIIRDSCAPCGVHAPYGAHAPIKNS